MSTRYQPHFHFFQPQGWLNDPNGLVYYKGEYHLFYQYVWPRSWGHAVSLDLLHWQHLPVALEPDELGDIWSGSVVVDTNDSSGFFGGGSGLVAIFTHQKPEQGPPLGPQVQSIAYSSDAGRTWTKYAQNPVIPNPGVSDFRDPKVFWHVLTERWVLVAAFNNDRLRIYHSHDLKHWTFASEFQGPQPVHKAMWECPDMFELPIDGDSECTRWVVQVSFINSEVPLGEQALMRYFLGTFDGTTFTLDAGPESVQATEHGPDNYAMVSWSDIPAQDGRRLWLGWMNHWKYADKVPTRPWQGCMTIPRAIQLKSINGHVRLFQKPVFELQQLRQDELHLRDVRIEASQPFALPIHGDALEIIALFQLEQASEVGFQIRVGPAQKTLVSYDADNASVRVDRTLAGESAFHPGFAGKHGGPVMTQEDMLKLHIFVDASSVEVFVNDGELVLSELIFPDPESQGLAVYALGGAALLTSLEVYRLASVW